MSRCKNCNGVGWLPPEDPEAEPWIFCRECMGRGHVLSVTEALVALAAALGIIFIGYTVLEAI
jgi:hypothetical protein